MIRFACPGCSSTFTVDDEKAGKTGKCPKCQTQFVIPAADAGILPPPLPVEAPPPLPESGTVADPAAPVEIDPCPKCQTRLSVTVRDLGVDVECPYCRTVFTARNSANRPPAPPPLPPSRPVAQSAVGSGRRTAKQRYEDEDDDDRPRNRRRRDDDEDDDRRPRSRRDDYDDEDERPSRRRRRRRHSVESMRVTAGVLALLLGSWGVHKFYLGYTNAGVIQLVLTLFTCGTAGIIAFIEGIMYLTKTDDEFIETYQIGKKEWF